MRVLGRPVGLAEQAALLLYLQRALAGGEPVGAAPGHQQRPLVLEGVGDLRHVHVLFLEEQRRRVRQLGHRRAQLFRLAGVERPGGGPDLQAQEIKTHEPRRQHRHVGAATLAGRETDVLVAQLFQRAPGRIGQADGEKPPVAGQPAGLERLEAAARRRLQDEGGRLRRSGPVVRELVGLLALGGPAGPLPEQERPELGGVEGRPAPGEDEPPDAPLDEAPGESGQLRSQAGRLPHQCRLPADVLDEEVGMPLPNVAGTPYSGPERHAGELFLQPGRQRVVRRGGRRPGVRVHQIARPLRQSSLCR